jgi:GT2 family glycosyltransferase
MSKKAFDLSVIILSYNTRDLLHDCLKSVLRSSRGKLRFETIVVDNASTDGSPEMIREEFPQVKLIRSKKNLGFSGGNNLGIEKARGNLLLFLNSDTKLKPRAIKKAVCFMKRHPRAGAMTPKTMLFSGGMDPDCHRGFPTPWASISFFLGLEKLFPKSKLFGRYHQLYRNLNRVHEIDAGFGTFMIVRRDVIDQVGDWDDQYFFYGEDLDYFYRIKQAGWKVMFYPQNLLTHYKGASSGLRKESRQVSPADRQTRVTTARASVKAMEIFYRKFYRDKYPAWVTAIVLLGIKIKGLFRILNHRIR